MTKTEEEKLNQKLVKQLYKKNYFTDKRIGRAFINTPRHFFVPDTPLELVYLDQVIPTKYDADKRPISSSSQPAMMAIMLEQLALEPGMNVLEIGAGTGFNAGLMADLVGHTGHVTTLDIDEDLVRNAHAHLQAAGVVNVTIVQTDGMHGYEANAPYDRIILTVSAADIATAWFEQLKEGGRLLLPLSLNGPQKSIAFEKQGRYLSSNSIQNCGFMTLRGEMANTSTIDIVLSDPAEGEGLRINLPADVAVDAQQLLEWVTHPAEKWETGISTTSKEIWSSFSLWLALSESQICHLETADAWYQHPHIPKLLHFTASNKPMALTFGIIDEGGLALLSNSGSQDMPLHLEISSYGNPAPAQRLLAQVEAWNEAQRPFTEQLHIDAYPHPAQLPPQKDAHILERPFTTFVITW